MTTRLQLRTTIREILEDLAPTGSPLWSDAALNEYLAAAIRAYGARFPRQAMARPSRVVRSERQLDQHPPDAMVWLSLTDDVLLRSSNWACWQLGIPLPVD